MIDVAAGILMDAQGRVLLMQRLPGKHLAGLWEFPGGKAEPGEPIDRALVRELDEELGIAVLSSVPLISLPWHYPGKSVRLHALRVLDWHGEPQAREGHPLRWVHPRGIDLAAMPAADAPIVAALRLPAHYVIASNDRGLESFLRARTTPEPAAADSDSVPPLPQALLQLRMPDAPREEVRRIASAWLAAVPSLRERLLVNRDVELARELGIGVHLGAMHVRGMRERPLPTGVWVGASCHGAEELELAVRFGVDFATLSPVRATTSHPGTPPLGWDRFAQLVADARLPVYALGGVAPDDLQRAREAGAQGVAGIRAFLA
jgi:8-oxo-dGTP diphosphatase